MKENDIFEIMQDNRKNKKTSEKPLTIDKNKVEVIPPQKITKRNEVDISAQLPIIDTAINLVNDVINVIGDAYKVKQQTKQVQAQARAYIEAEKEKTKQLEIAEKEKTKRYKLELSSDFIKMREKLELEKENLKNELKKEEINYRYFNENILIIKEIVTNLCTQYQEITEELLNIDNYANKAMVDRLDNVESRMISIVDTITSWQRTR
ncbi:MAG: hypothetical protein ACOCRK_05020 [bacterium]